MTILERAAELARRPFGVSLASRPDDPSGATAAELQRAYYQRTAGQYDAAHVDENAENEGLAYITAYVRPWGRRAPSTSARAQVRPDADGA